MVRVPRAQPGHVQYFTASMLHMRSAEAAVVRLRDFGDLLDLVVRLRGLIHRVYSNDVEKMHRWEETAALATDNECIEVVTGIPDFDFYFVNEPTTYAIGPAGGPMYRLWGMS